MLSVLASPDSIPMKQGIRLKLTYAQATELDNQDPPQPRADTVNSIESGDEGMIMFVIDGAVFAERVSPNDFALSDANADVELMSGGAKGGLVGGDQGHGGGCLDRR